jgi:hypothetical protein
VCAYNKTNHDEEHGTGKEKKKEGKKRNKA